ncbi:MAG: FecR domain-containing protein [Pseudomonadota bacterium]
MNTDQQTKLLEEAALIFVQLREAPDDPELIAERDIFLAKGPDARAAFEKIEDGWKVSGGRTRSRTPTILSLVLLAALSWYFGAKPVQDYIVADASSGSQILETTLDSGDLAILGADSALVDETNDGIRSVRLLRGAAVFDVTSDTRPFIVTLGDAEVRVRGTVFETAYLSDVLAVSVADGTVDVSINGKLWVLTAGDRLEWTASDGAVIRSVPLTDVASWQSDELVVADAPLVHVVEVIDRRLGGDVVILGSDLARTRVSGRFDLRDPQSALRVLAATIGADYYSGAPLVSVLVRTE